MKFLLLSDCRAGGTNLIRTLGQHPDIVTQGELLLEHWLMNRPPKDFPKWFANSFGNCNGWHLQRYQLPWDWHAEYIASMPVKIIDLKRLDMVGQYRSLKRAMATGQWEKKTPVDMEIPFDANEMLECHLQWSWLHRRFDRIFADSDRFETTFEKLCDNFVGEVEKIQRFLGINPIYLEPVMQR